MLASKAFWSSTAERAIKTFAQSALALLGTDQLISALAINWGEIAGVALLAAILSVLTSIAFPGADTKAAVRLEAGE